jgi:hypothetical protein
MDQLQIDFPRSLIGWLTLITLLVVAVAFVFYTWRNQSIKLLRESVDDMGKRITYLEAELKRLCEEKGILEANYKETKFKKNYLKQIVVEALAKKSSINHQLAEIVKDNNK